MWRDPLKLAALALIVLILARIIAAPYVDPEIRRYAEIVGVCLTLLLLVLAVMRRKGRL
jgi:hypothetical protein